MYLSETKSDALLERTIELMVHAAKMVNHDVEFNRQEICRDMAYLSLFEKTFNNIGIPVIIAIDRETSYVKRIIVDYNSYKKTYEFKDLKI